ncbi:VTT domain-containing protein [Polyangium sp. 15x6]|uniref:VTT domain-containing protein n=1 Tax=Polyangium sp. 15x6 TaxID=3042687 RepID=UPI00249CA37E|nr:VTT domain-containing protein [Polyangium sp. 15x6]MDI3285743.1 hypothetical protein [Polyangium sp. 15x6]
MPNVVPTLAMFFGLVMLAAFVPQPLTPATLLAGKAAPPWALALVAAVAAALAAFLDHRLVRTTFKIKALAEIRKKSLFQRAEGWVKVAPFLTTAAFAALPLPFIIVRVLMPLSGYPALRYAVAVGLGRAPRVYVIAIVGKELDIPTELLAFAIALGALVSLAAFVRQRRASRT